VVQVIQAHEFVDKVLSSPLPVVIDVFTPFCAPCRAMEPGVNSVAAKLAGQVNIYKLDLSAVDFADPGSKALMQVLQAASIQSVPALLLFNDGSLTSIARGFRRESDIMAWLAEKAGVVPPAAPGPKPFLN
jgi:thioredoxin 1